MVRPTARENKEGRMDKAGCTHLLLAPLPADADDVLSAEGWEECLACGEFVLPIPNHIELGGEA